MFEEDGESDCTDGCKAQSYKKFIENIEIDYLNAGNDVYFLRQQLASYKEDYESERKKRRHNMDIGMVIGLFLSGILVLTSSTDGTLLIVGGFVYGLVTIALWTLQKLIIRRLKRRIK